jgi:hypothetical protein
MSDATKSWDIALVEGIYQKNCTKIRKALKRKEARIDRQVAQDDEHHFFFGEVRPL